MKRTLLRSCLITACVLALPGCLAINALLGAAGILVGGPVQYAATVYSVGEYTYHYAVNGMTPDEVIEDKFAWLTDPDEPEAVAVVPRTVVALADSARLDAAPAQDTGLHRATPVMDTPVVRIAPLPETLTASAALRTTAPANSKRPRPATMHTSVPEAQKPEARPSVIAMAQPLPVSPSHTYVNHPADPLLERMSRIEHGLAQAERIMDRETGHGVRVSLQSDDAGQTGSVSGAWSIRHPVMQENPAPVAPPTFEASAETDHRSS